MGEWGILDMSFPRMNLFCTKTWCQTERTETVGVEGMCLRVRAPLATLL